MNRILILAFWILFVMLTVAGCAPADSEAANPKELPVVIEPPTSTESPAAEPTVLVPVTGPTMEVGSTYPYADGSILIAVPAGEFIMGADGADNPEHELTLGDFWIGSTKVTNQQYALCVSLGKCTEPDGNDNPGYAEIAHANDPIVGVTYSQAATYCSFVNGRLPTEAEWEKSARGPEGSLYPWGNAEPSCDLLNFNDCVGDTTNVTNYQDGASFYSGLDFAGNVYEWVLDWYAADYYENSPTENPQGPEGGTMRSVRSSSYASGEDQVALYTRSAENPQIHRSDLGFRCVVENPTYFAPVCEAPAVYTAVSGQDASSYESCPALDITQAQYCAGKLPLTNVEFVGPSGSTIDSQNCTPSDDPNLFTCGSPETVVSITGTCDLSNPGDPSCLAGFSQQDNACVADGATGECLAGNYNESNHCCSAPQGDSSSILAICPVGTFYSASENACHPYPIQGIITVSLEVGYVSCTSSGGSRGDNDPNNPTPTVCQEPENDPCQSSTWSPVCCMCLYPDESCP